MRKNNHILLAVASLLLAGTTVSCNEDTYIGGVSGTNVVSVATATVGTSTRATANDTEFAVGDAFRLSTSADGTGAATYTLGADGWRSTAPLLWGSTLPVTYHAAYPATATYNNFTLPTDQSDGTANANYMTASVEAQERTALSLAFEHKTAQVIVKITRRTAGNDGTLTDAVIRSPHSEYADATVTGNAISVSPQPASANGTGEETRYTALVLPGTAEGFNLFSAKINGKEATFTTDVAFEENRIYEYTLTIGKDRVTLEDFSVKEWTAKDLTAEMTPQWDGTAADSYAGGKGTKDEPYLIVNAAQLAYLGKRLEGNQPYYNTYFKLTADIDLAGANWTPMGIKTAFGGYFDGGGHTVRNMNITASELSIEQSTGYYYGLFAQVFVGGIRNLTVEDATINVTTSDNVSDIGVIVGEFRTDQYSGERIIDNCHVKNAKISYKSGLNSYIGGIAGTASAASGYLSPIIFSRCTVEELTVTDSGDKGIAGGICGHIEYGRIQIFASSATGTLNGNYTGGLVGYQTTGKFIASGSYADCTLNGANSAAIVNINNSTNPRIIWDYLAGRGADVLRSGGKNVTSKDDYKEEECHLFNSPSKVYGIVANEANATTFTVDGTTYDVKDCWQDNGNALPTLKVSKDGKTN